MCKSTTGAQTPGATSLIDIEPNTATNHTPITPTFTLQQYLSKAYSKALVANELGAQPADDSTANLHVPISLYAHVRSGGNHFYAGIHDNEMHCSASLLKVAAMYAAFSLRAEARELAKAGGFANTKLTALNLTDEVAECWQNVRESAFDTGVPAIATMIETTFANFLAQTPI